ncbi:MAG: hypothetical protein Q9170_005791 [Blastenia crenularia]
MHFNQVFITSMAMISILPGTLAAPALDTYTGLERRWFTVNPGALGGNKPWPDHKLRYKFKDDNSKSKLKDLVKAGWKLWTDGGVDTANIDIEESTDNDALEIEVVTDAKAQTTVGYTGGATMTFGDSASYGLLDKTQNMAHELGHALGFYHEHQRDDRDTHVVFNCQNLADWTEKREKEEGFCTDMITAKNSGFSSLDYIIQPQSRQEHPLNCYSQNYDEDSIMHYPGGAGAAKPLVGHRKTVLGTISDPNKSFKKNTKPSISDIARANVMYTTNSNAKRDIGKDCRSQARLSATYSAPAALTSALNMTAAPIDITGTPIISTGVTDQTGTAEAAGTGSTALGTTSLGTGVTSTAEPSTPETGTAVIGTAGTAGTTTAEDAPPPTPTTTG